MTSIADKRTRPVLKIEKPYGFLVIGILISLLSALALIERLRPHSGLDEESVRREQELKAAINGLLGQPFPPLILKSRGARISSSEELFTERSLVLILNSLECGPCKDMAGYFEHLVQTCGSAFNYYAIVRPIGRTAISDYQKANHLSYDFYENLNSTVFSEGYFSSASLVIAVSTDRKILCLVHSFDNGGGTRRDFERQLRAY
jgi:hypothetical protein